MGCRSRERGGVKAFAEASSEEVRAAGLAHLQAR